MCYYLNFIIPLLNNVSYIINAVNKIKIYLNFKNEKKL